MKAVLAAAVIAGIAGLTASAAQADTIIEMYTFPSPLVGYTNEDGSSFSEFNPALGTLNSITLNATATATFSGGGSSFNAAEYYIFLTSNDNFFSMNAETEGNGTAPAAISNLTTTSDLSSYIGTGDVQTSVYVEKSEGTTSISSTFGTETLTYNYTPAVPTPEPTSLSLVGVGLVGLAFARRRKSRCRYLVGVT